MMEIRSYRRVFDLERRIYRVDGLRLNPGGVPVRGIVYLLALVAAVLVAARLPVLGIAASALPWYVRDVVLPGAMAALLSVIRIEGRPFHLAAYALVRHGMQARRSSRARRLGGPGARWCPGELLFLPDGSDGRLRNISYSGPGAVMVAVAHERSVAVPRFLGRGPGALVLRQIQTATALDQRQVIALGPGARLLVQARARTETR
jgi:hypothetical protein